MHATLTRLALVLALVLGLSAVAPETTYAQVKISNASASAAADAVVVRIDLGAGAGTLRIFTACPATANDADTGTLLAELTFSDPAFGAAVNGVATASAITQDSSANATGTAACFRVADSNAVIVFQGTVSTTGADMNLVTTAITATQPVSITSFTYTHPLQ